MERLDVRYSVSNARGADERPSTGELFSPTGTPPHPEGCSEVIQRIIAQPAASLDRQQTSWHIRLHRSPGFPREGSACISAFVSDTLRSAYGQSCPRRHLRERALNNFRRAVALTASLAFSSSAFSYSCTGAVVAPAVDPITGDVLVGNIGELVWPRICNLRATSSNGISPEACRAVYAMLLTAHAEGRQVSINSTSTSIASCKAAPPWTVMDGFSWLVIN